MNRPTYTDGFLLLSLKTSIKTLVKNIDLILNYQNYHPIRWCLNFFYNLTLCLTNTMFNDFPYKEKLAIVKKAVTIPTNIKKIADT